MKKYTRFILVALFSVGVVILSQLSNATPIVTLAYEHMKSPVVMNGPVSEFTASNFTEANIRLLTIYDTVEKKNLATVDQELTYLKIPHQNIPTEQFSSVSPQEYSGVIVLVSDWESLNGGIQSLLDYAEEGGRVLFAVVPNTAEGVIDDYYQRLGISEFGVYCTTAGLRFVNAVIPGTAGQKFKAEEFGDVSLTVRLDSSCKTYIENTDDKTPILWERSLKAGKIVMFNGCNLPTLTYCGVFTGCLGLMEDNLLYPIINASVIFLDDFPAPYVSANDKRIQEAYNRSFPEFLRDIWWPDMISLAKRDDLVYTGVFIMTYQSDTSSNNLYQEISPLRGYFGQTLLRNSFELGFHGYNHQPLCPLGYLEQDPDYKPWYSKSDMEKAVSYTSNYMTNAFHVKITSYVPPSNELSPEGRDVIAVALPDLKIISGVFDSDRSDAYTEKFEIAKDGIVEFPRITNGMQLTDSTRFSTLNGLALLGVFSHFIHPDDIISDERGQNESWDTLLKGFEQIVDEAKATMPVRSLRASDAADATKVYVNMKLLLGYTDQGIDGAINNFYGEAYFLLRTSHTPRADNSCQLTKIDTNYYFVRVTSSSFHIFY